MSRTELALILAALFAGTLFLRLRGIDWMLPHRVEPDAHLASQLEGFRAGRTDWGDGVDYSKYPHLLARLLQPFPGLERPERLGAAALAPELGPHLRRASGAVLEMRVLVALLGSALAPLTFLLARRFLSSGWSLLAAGFVATSLLNQHYAQQARPHAAAATLALAAVLAALRLRGRPTPGAYLLAGGAAALALGGLHSGVAALFPLAAAHFLAERGERGSGAARWLARPLLAALPVAAALWLFYPFLFSGDSPPGDVAQGSALEAGAGGLTQSAHTIQWSQFDGAGFQRVLWTLISYEPAGLALALLGIAAGLAGWVRFRGPAPGPGAGRDLAVVLSYAVPYALVIGLFSVTYQRFVLPLLPFLACAAAAGTARLAGWLPHRVGRGVLVAAVLVWPAWTTWRLGSLRKAPDTLERAASWIAEHTLRGVTRTVVSPGYDLPLARRPEAVRADEGLPRGIRPELWMDYQTRLLDARGPQLPLFESGHLVFRLPVRGRRELVRLTRRPAEFLGSLGAERVVVPVIEKQRNTVAWLLREDARQRGELLARFSPEKTEALWVHPFDFREEPYGDPMHFGLRVLRANAIGPTVEVYSLPVGE